MELRLAIHPCDAVVAMMDELVKQAQKLNIKKIIGYYYPTQKNAMVKDFYSLQGFKQTDCDKDGNTIWEYIIPNDYQNMNKVIKVNE